MLHTDAPGPRDFWAMRQEKTLSLAWVLQACTKTVRGPNRHSLQIGMRTSNVHGLPDGPKLGQYSWVFHPKTHGRGTWNIPQSGGGSHSPGQGNRTTTSSTFFPRMTRNPQVCRTCPVKYCSYCLFSIPCALAQLTPFPEGKETPERD